MKSSLLLLDVSPDPVTSVVGIGGLILIVLIVLMLSAAGIVGFVFLLRWLKRRQPKISPASQNVADFQNSPNQP